MTAHPKGGPKGGPYVMPAVEPGMAVTWYNGPDRTLPEPAVVVKVHAECVDLGVYVAGSYNLLPKSGVRHADFPNRQLVANLDVGCWEHNAATRRLDEALRGLAHEMSLQERSIYGVAVSLKAAQERIAALEKKK